MKKAASKIGSFLMKYIEDVAITLGILLIVYATATMFGMGYGLYVLGASLIVVGVVDFHHWKEVR